MKFLHVYTIQLLYIPYYYYIVDTLTIADHYYVTQYLRSLNSEELVLLGLALGLLYPSLQRMKSTPGGLPNDMIAAWLRKDSNVTEPPTWTSLAAALEKNDHNGLASDIRRGNGCSQQSLIILFIIYYVIIRSSAMPSYLIVDARELLLSIHHIHITYIKIII